MLGSGFIKIIKLCFSVIINTKGIRATERDRTADLRITNALLYQLSYSGFLIVIKNTVILSFEEKGIRQSFIGIG